LKIDNGEWIIRIQKKKNNKKLTIRIQNKKRNKYQKLIEKLEKSKLREVI
jgi:hypothetical protein